VISDGLQCQYNNPAVCKSFADSGSAENKTTVFWIKSTSVRSISTFSKHWLEDEYILLPSTELKIINKTIDRENTNLNVVEMEEILVVRDSKYITL
jgi:hypothetical protein